MVDEAGVTTLVGVPRNSVVGCPCNHGSDYSTLAMRTYKNLNLILCFSLLPRIVYSFPYAGCE